MNSKQEKLDRLIDVLRHERAPRVRISKESFLMFFLIYLGHYMKYEMAPFQREMFELAENEGVGKILYIGFRGSAKSTILNLGYILWAALGKQQKKFILIASQTLAQARSHLHHIREELERNTLLRNDLGPFDTESDEFGIHTILLRDLGVRISTISVEQQGIRGIRERQHRPDLIVADDLEDLQSTKTKEGRAKTREWLFGTVLPAGDKGTRLILLGGVFNEYSLLAKLKEDIAKGDYIGVYREIPIVDTEGNPTWPGKFKDKEEILKQRKEVPDEHTWQREYMLKIVSYGDQIIKEEWIKYYDQMPKEDYVQTFIGIDPAISKKETADYTAMVGISVFGYGDKMRCFVHPFPVNQRLSFNETKDMAVALAKSLGRNCPATLIVEDQGYQQVLVEDLTRLCFDVRAFKTGGVDKESRLRIASSLLQSGQMFFPSHGCEDLVENLLRFQYENYNDLGDAFCMVALQIKQDPPGDFIVRDLFADDW